VVTAVLTVMVGVGVELTNPLVAVIVAAPAPTAVNVTGVPLGPESGLTVSTAVLLESQPTVRPVRMFPLPSLVVAVSCCIPPTTIGVVGAEIVTAATGAGLTSMFDVVALGAVSLDAEIVAAPTPVAVIVTVAPLDVLSELTALRDRIAGLLEIQFTVRPDSALLLLSFGVAVNTCVPPTTIGVTGAESVTIVTGIGFTVMVGVGIELTDSLVAVIVAVPAPTAVTVAGEPLAPTVSTAVLLETHVTERPVSTLPFASFIVAVRC
jgi:hypothetical protein